MAGIQKSFWGKDQLSYWNLEDLQEWDEKICRIAKQKGLDGYPIVYETCDYYEMIGNMAYHGMPSHYSHWSHGKSFERTHQMYTMPGWRDCPMN